MGPGGRGREGHHREGVGEEAELQVLLEGVGEEAELQVLPEGVGEEAELPVLPEGVGEGAELQEWAGHLQREKNTRTPLAQ